MAEDKAVNPFLNHFELRCIKLIKQANKVDAKHIHENEGIITQWTKEETEIIIEEQKKCNVYRITGADNIFFDELDNNGRSLFMYITMHLQFNRDYISLKSETVCKVLKCSRTTLHRAIVQLADIGLITKKMSKYDYWVNPNYLYNGNRVNYIAKMQSVSNSSLQIVANQYVK
jgi:predicted transcriptional regulator